MYEFVFRVRNSALVRNINFYERGNNVKNEMAGDDLGIVAFTVRCANLGNTYLVQMGHGLAI